MIESGGGWTVMPHEVLQLRWKPAVGLALFLFFSFSPDFSIFFPVIRPVPYCSLLAGIWVFLYPKEISLFGDLRGGEAFVFDPPPLR